jgi:hypothetical protein
MTTTECFSDASRGTDSEALAWTCAICGRPRHCPYAAPSAGDPTETCVSCGDLLAVAPCQRDDKAAQRRLLLM